MRSITPLLFIFVLTFSATAQKPADILATATGHIFRFSDLKVETQKLVTEAPANYVKTRANLYDQFVALRLLEAEAAPRNMTAGQIIIAERAKVHDPTEAQIKAVYDANRSQLGNNTLAQVHDQIVAYIRYEPEQKALTTLIALLKPKFKFTPGKDVNAANLAAADVIGTLNGKPLTAKEFETFAAFDLFELRDHVTSTVLSELSEKLQAAILEGEAKTLGVDSGTLIAREITDKLKDFSDQEREKLENALRDRLYAKYQVKILYKKVEPLVESISTDDDPATGPADAPVTVIMFSDFQCSACSAVHPLLKEAMAAYPGKIRFVVRDCPLETVHDHAYRAALAGYAAHQQEKFFEYVEILYKNQAALDDGSLIKYAAGIGLNAKQFELDFRSEKAAAEVKKDIIDGENYGIHSTPTIFVNGVRARNFSVEGFRTAIDFALKK